MGGKNAGGWEQHWFGWVRWGRETAVLYDKLYMSLDPCLMLVSR